MIGQFDILRMTTSATLVDTKPHKLIYRVHPTFLALRSEFRDNSDLNEILSSEVPVQVISPDGSVSFV